MPQNPILKQPLTLTFDGLIQNAVSEELKKRASKTVVSEGMKAAGMQDVQKLLATFGITPAVINQALTLAFKYLENTAAAKGAYGPPNPGGFGPLGPSPFYQPQGPPPEPPRAPTGPPPPSQSVTLVEISPEATYNRHLGLLKHMLTIYGDIPVSEALKRFDEQKADIITVLAADMKPPG
jgi:hypothetical protein